MPRPLATDERNHLYELGWREGWIACLHTIEREGLAAVQANERLLAQSHPLPLQLEHQERTHATAGADAP